MAASSLPSSRFLIQNSRGEKIPAVVAVKPPHFTSAAEKNAPLNVSDMGRFLKDQLTRIGPLSVQFDETDERPVQVFHTRRFEAVIASERADAIVACLAHLSRAEAQRMIRSGLVQKDHIALEKADELCNNGCTISIRGCGRFTYLGVLHRTRKDRIVAEFLQDL